MRIYSSEEIKEWDAFTCRQEEIDSFMLMQRAAYQCAMRLQKLVAKTQTVQVCCGPGNNGGDGLLIAAYLFRLGYSVYLYATDGKGSADREKALAYAQQALPVIPLAGLLPAVAADVTIDCLFGHGLQREADTLYKEIILKINSNAATVISIDIPSGMPSEPQDSVFQTIVKANVTLTFQRRKQSFFLDEYAQHCGRVEVLDIGLSPLYSPDTTSPFLVGEGYAKGLFSPKTRFSHKGTYGSVLLTGGSIQYPGAMHLCIGAALASGVGKTFVAVPEAIRTSCRTRFPEAIYLDGYNGEALTSLPANEPYTATAVGPGMGQLPQTEKAFGDAHPARDRPLVMDADALNLLSRRKDFPFPDNCVLTPHPGEFDRLTRPHSSTGERWKTAASYSKQKQVVVVLKGAYTAVFFPDGKCYLNNSGNAGLAKGGSGDVLTGFMAGLMGRGYPVHDAVLLAVYLHGSAADKIITGTSMDGLRAGELIDQLRQQLAEWEN